MQSPAEQRQLADTSPSETRPLSSRAEAEAILRTDLGLAVDDLLPARLDTEYLQRYAELSRAAHRRNALAPADRELLMLALYASPQLYNQRAVDLHTRRALERGATPTQILGTRVETLGTHTLSFGVPLLMEELAARGGSKVPHSAELTEAQQAVKDRLIEIRGWWNEGWLPLLQLDPHFLLATHELLGAAEGILDPKLRELIYMAFDVSTAHLYAPGARAHLRNAMGFGATVDEIMEVFELTALVGYRSLLLVLEAVDGAGEQRGGNVR
ncbi:hypothetical protein A5761_01725 [Mycolicibacterium setense]|uniref:carboxymuconolactone decarboxylase family protein n=1 Tax=Mycolicibacterium setense TaxID=431269 RepID=UPI0007E94690|nr:carboxymuconolactone decarboxylase family protein [Mycolicibacterium setense]OBB14644.1 hypothetical protein A5761_01725 [Mycolicibacterium setense]